MKTSSLGAFLLSFLAVEGVHATAWAQSKVTCVGDSITSGDGLASTYPQRLQSLFGSTAIVQNAGYNGATMLSSGDVPYATTSTYVTSTDFLAQGGDVVIQLGANDSTRKNWTSSAAFAQDCKDLVRHYQSTSPLTRVWVSLVPPALDAGCCNVDGTVIRNEIIPALRTCVTETGVSSVDVFSALDGHPEYFGDGVHPNDQGAAVIAQTVYSKLSRRPEVTLISSGPSAAEGGALGLTAGPSAAYGAIETVRFYEGRTLLAEVTSAPWTLLIDGLTRGAHVYHVEAIETGGRLAESRPISIKVTESATPSTDAPITKPEEKDVGTPNPALSSSPSPTPKPSASAIVESKADASEGSSGAASGCSIGGGADTRERHSSWAYVFAVSALMTALHKRRRPA